MQNGVNCMNKWQEAYSALKELQSKLNERDIADGVLALIVGILIMLVEDKIHGEQQCSMNTDSVSK